MYPITMQINCQLFMYLFIYTFIKIWLLKWRPQNNWIVYRSFSQFFLQVKNILSYKCIHKPNIIQRNIIDCMELRSAEIRSHIVIGRTSRVYSPCVLRLLLPLHHPSLSSPLHQINPHHMLYSNPRYMLYSNPRHMLYSNPRHMFIWILVTCYIRIHH